MAPEHHCYDYATRNRQMLTGLLSVELSPLSPGSGSDGSMTGSEFSRCYHSRLSCTSGACVYRYLRAGVSQQMRLSTLQHVTEIFHFFPLFCVTDPLLYVRSVTQTCSKCAKPEKIFIYYSATILIFYFTFFISRYLYWSVFLCNS